MPPELKIDYHSFFLFVRKFKVESISLAIIVVVLILYIFAWSAPVNFPKDTIYDLKSGQTLSVLSDNFVKLNVVKSGFWFKSFAYVFSFGNSKIIEGNYALNNKQDLITLAWRVSHGQLDIVPVKITIPEGLSSFEIANILSNKFPSFNKNTFLNLVESQKLEGYLFPDTYFFMPDTTEAQMIKLMNDNFDIKTKTISTEIKNFGKSESDVIKMSSILEGEARTLESREIIAGILWKRISMRMPLQVDSSFKYINGKTSANLTSLDLQIDSPYNSYTNIGLPPTPISNPGLGAIEAAINPIKTPYLYFLTDKDGNMHYAVTFEEHVANKLKYLNN